MTVRGIIIYAVVAWFGHGIAVVQAAQNIPEHCSKPRAAPLVQEATYRGLEQAADLIRKEHYDAAIDRLQRLTRSGSDYEKALAFFNLGFAHAGKKNLKGQQRAFEQALSLKALPQEQQEQLQYNLAQIYIVDGQYQPGIRTMEAFITESCRPVSADAYLFLAQAHAQQKQYRQALAALQRGMTSVPKVTDEMLQLQLALNYELKNYAACADTLLQLLGRHPQKPDYWQQLAGMYYELKQDVSWTAVQALEHRQGLLTKPAELRALYGAYMVIGAPLKAGRVLDEAIDKHALPMDEKTLEALANAWINARERGRAEGVLKRLVAMSSSGEYAYRLGAMYADEERWKEAARFLEQALAKGGLKTPGQAWLRLAVARINLNDREKAIAAMRQATQHRESQATAREWLRFLDQQGAS